MRASESPQFGRQPGSDRSRNQAKSNTTIVEADLLGTVKWYNVEKGYGFIVPDRAGDDIFVHATAVNESAIQINQDERVRFDLERDAGRNRTYAVNLRTPEAPLSE